MSRYFIVKKIGSLKNLEHQLKEEGVQVANIYIVLKNNLDTCFLLASTGANREP